MGNIAPSQTLPYEEGKTRQGDRQPDHHMDDQRAGNAKNLRDRFPGVWGAERRRQADRKHAVSHARPRHIAILRDPEEAQSGYLPSNASRGIVRR